MAQKDYWLDWDLVNAMEKTDLTKLTKRYAAAVNRRIDTFLPSERKKSGAYKKLETYIGAPYLSRYGKRASKTSRGAIKADVKKDLTINEMREALRVFEAYLGSKTSFSTGWKKVEREREKKTKEKFGKAIGGDKISDFLNFLGDRRISEAMKKGDSDVVYIALQTKYTQANYDIDKLKEEFEDFLARNISYTKWLNEMGYTSGDTISEGWFKI